MGRGARAFDSSDEMNVLRIDHLSKSFGRLNVTDDVSLTIAEGERHVIIGPNGAGKTSLINQISGQIQPESGRILLRGQDIAGFSPDRISRMGVARTFQRNNLFQNLSVMDNMRLALQVRQGNPLNFFSPAAANTILTERAATLLAEVHLAFDDSRLVRQLSYGEQRQLELALALAGEPSLLLLDEPTSGMSPSETARIIELISALPRALSILMIEHDMQVVFSIADRITVLYYGRVLATGTPEEIQNNDRVREIYLGLSH
jgi:branched-chain amino acid transport system ATP-binding protein